MPFQPGDYVCLTRALAPASGPGERLQEGLLGEVVTTACGGFALVEVGTRGVGSHCVLVHESALAWHAFADRTLRVSALGRSALATWPVAPRPVAEWVS